MDTVPVCMYGRATDTATWEAVSGVLDNTFMYCARLYRVHDCVCAQVGAFVTLCLRVRTSGACTQYIRTLPTPKGVR